MKVRDLIISESINQTSRKEFNHVRVVNLDKFFEDYRCNFDYYAAPFQILADLEKAIKYLNNPESTVTVAYKDDGGVIFDLVGIEEKKELRIVKYEFATFIS